MFCYNDIYLIFSSTYGYQVIQCPIISIQVLGKFISYTLVSKSNHLSTLYRTWFYFACKGAEKGKLVHFHIKNMNF